MRRLVVVSAMVKAVVVVCFVVLVLFVRAIFVATVFVFRIVVLFVFHNSLLDDTALYCYEAKIEGNV